MCDERFRQPEQLAGRAVPIRSGLHSLGLIRHEVFSGKRAFEGPRRRYAAEHARHRRYRLRVVDALLGQSSRPAGQAGSRASRDRSRLTAVVQTHEPCQFVVLTGNALRGDVWFSRPLQGEVARSEGRQGAYRSSTGYVRHSSPTF